MVNRLSAKTISHFVRVVICSELINGDFHGDQLGFANHCDLAATKINIPVADSRSVVVGSCPGVHRSRDHQTGDRKGHGAWVARHTNCCRA